MSTETNRPASPRHTIPPQPWRSQAQIVAILTLVVLVGVIIGALYLIQSTTTTTTVRELDQMSEERSRLERDNERLRAEIAELESLPRQMTRAAEMGFRPAQPNEIMWVPVQGYRYDRPQVTPTPTPTPEAPEPVYDETLSGWLRKQWATLKQQFDDWRNGG